LYSQFKEAVKNADVVIVIGYGWGDEHINTMINQNISDNCKLINITLSDGAAMLPFNCGLKEGLIAVTQSGAKSVLSGGQFKAKKAQAALLFNKPEPTDLKSLLCKILLEIRNSKGGKPARSLD
jgi:hypothetical protein